MCGFLGEFSFQGQLSHPGYFDNLLLLSKHRGPDSTQVSEGKNYRLGFNRLALLDLTASGEQPKYSPSQRFHLMFNGEIYNYKELSEKHQLHNLRSTSDTEVLLHLLDKIGIEETIEQLNGMFAIAVVDIVKNELYLSRDFAGIKPLFYGFNELGIVCASQFDQVFKHPWLKNNLKLRGEVVREYFAFGYMAAPNTVYENIFQVNPGEMIVFTGAGNFIKKSIVHFPKETYLDALYDSGQLESTIKNAVRLQLNTDRSLATFLSGGVDSTLVSGFAKDFQEGIEAFTLKVNDKEYNESGYAINYAHHLNLKHKIVEVDEGYLLSAIEDHFDAFAEPFGDYSSLPTYLVTKKASHFHTAMLSGDGGDELFWGYPRMYEFLEKAWWFQMPLFLRKNILRITNRLKITDSYAPYRRNLETYWMEWHIKLPQYVLNAAFNDGFSSDMENLYHLNKNYSKKQLQQFLRWNEFYGHLQRILIKVDRTSMKNSLEVRVPLLDKNVIERSWEVFYKINGLKDLKKPLKELVSEKIPPHLLMEGKKGFSVPIEEWFRNQLKPDLIETVLNSELYGKECFDQFILKTYVRDFLDEKHNNGWGVWHIYAWQKWAERAFYGSDLTEKLVGENLRENH